MGIFENNRVDPTGDSVFFRMLSTASLWDKGESIHLNDIYQAPTLCMPGTAVGGPNRQPPVLTAGKRGSPSLCRLCARDMNMTHSEREREAMQWAGRGTHLINHLVLSLPSPHILLESLPLMWLRNTLQSRRVAAALRGYYWT